MSQDTESLVEEAIAQAQAGSSLLFAHGGDQVLLRGRQLEHWRDGVLLRSEQRDQRWRRVIGELVRAALGEAPAAAPATSEAPPAASRRPPPAATVRQPAPSPPASPPAAVVERADPVGAEGARMPKLWTQSGYLLSEVISALQKEIRRGEEESAMDFALELVPKFENYLWRRLNVIVQEDIGLAAPELLALVPSQEAQFMRFREEGKDGTARLILANTILAMCRAPKSRLADHFQCVVNQRRQHRAERRPIPDYALDKHTGVGRKLGRGVEHWREEGCRLVPDAGLDDPYADEAYQWWASPDFKQTAWGKKRRSGPTEPEYEPEPVQHGMEF